jgi:hypothetical protein
MVITKLVVFFRERIKNFFSTAAAKKENFYERKNRNELLPIDKADHIMNMSMYITLSRS